MIGRLTGKVAEIRSDKIILDAHGVGYLVTCPSRCLGKLTRGENSTLQIHTYVKEDALELFGFLDKSDLQVFQNLITVSGVGPRLALTILSSYQASEIKEAIIQADATFFQSISGIGKKNAQKIIVELKSKFGSLKELDLAADTDKQYKNLIAALQSLGYTMAEIKPMLKSMPRDLSKLEDQVRYALKEGLPLL